ncbi:mitochondrial protein pet191 homolog isoform X2 [Mangifera indica]|uniref:mitochondrial protein pet191 homolog isoform X2 n=1 Tax=Mangifera indica TaxID=29780 RepID=UPI001CFB9CF5|nr:mitochondrial protein pet191 homolog isoform X2 [Mangifera indica]
MSKSCKGLAMELVKCLSESDCIKVEKRSYRECAGEKSPSISSECVGLRETYFNCKRGQVCNAKLLESDTALEIFHAMEFCFSRATPSL